MVCLINHFCPIDRDTGFLMPPLGGQVAAGAASGWFVVEVIAGLDRGAMTATIAARAIPRITRGFCSASWSTHMQRVFSSRKLERATYASAAFRFVAANEHPDNGTIAVFRRRALPQIEALFVQVLVLVREMGV